MAHRWMKRCGVWTGAMAAAALLLACSDSKTEAPAAVPAAPVAAPAPVTTEAKRVIDQLFSTETIGMNLAYVEKIAGPAMRSEFHRHQFRTDGCDITLISDEADKVIESVEVDIAPSCSLSLKSVLNVSEGQPDMQLNELTFGRFEPLLDGRYYADCLSLCGNAADPVVYLEAKGSRVTNFINYAVQAPMVDGPVLDATFAWRDAMTKAESEEYVVDTRFNCEPDRFRSVIATGLKNVKPTVFSFGRGPGFVQGDCD